MTLSRMFTFYNNQLNSSLPAKSYIGVKDGDFDHPDSPCAACLPGHLLHCDNILGNSTIVLTTLVG